MNQEELEKKVRHIQVESRRAVLELLAGEYKSHFKGSGIDFEDIRAYQHGDDVRGIDWNVTARTGQTHVKEFMEERELCLYFLIDISASANFGSVSESKRDAAAHIFALLAFAAAHHNDSIGLILFSDQTELYIKPGKGRKHIMQMIHRLLSFKAKSPKTSIKNALRFLNKVRRRPALVFLMSDFIDEDYQSEMRFTARQHDLLCLRINDRRESHLPTSGILEVRDAENGTIHTLDCSDAKLRQSLIARSREDHANLQNFCREIDANFLSLNTADDYLHALVSFFRKNRNGL